MGFRDTVQTGVVISLSGVSAPYPGCHFPIRGVVNSLSRVSAPHMGCRNVCYMVQPVPDGTACAIWYTSDHLPKKQAAPPVPSASLSPLADAKLKVEGIKEAGEPKNLD